MAIEKVIYKPGQDITEGVHYSMNLAFLAYDQDAFGNTIHGKTDNPADAANNPALQVRSLYTVMTNETDLAKETLTFEAVMQLISTRRARIVEAEIAPMNSVITNRNTTLEQLSKMLGSIGAGMVEQEQDRKNDKNSEGKGNVPGLGNFLLTYFTADELKNAKVHKNYANLLEWANAHTGASNLCTSTKTEGVFEVSNSLVKAKIDFLNNETQTDMARLNNLVQKRDESFEMASSLTSIVSDGRATTIRNMAGK